MDTEKGERGGKGSQGEDDNERQRLALEARYSDPYSILKLNRDANDEAIQRSYKHLSRTFHPDKQPPGAAREAAQEVFVSFKNSCDILSDPVQRQAYDEHGMFGVNVLKKSIHLLEKDPSSLYATLLKLHQMGQQEQARLVFREALQALNYQTKKRQVQFSSTMEFPCTTVASTFLGEGGELMTVPELQGAHVSFSVSSAPPTPDDKFSVTVGGSTNIKDGNGEGSGQISIGYQPVQATDVNLELDLSNPFKVSIGSTRKFSSRTVVTTKVSTMPNSDKLSLSVVSQRAIFDNKVLGVCAMGMGTDFAIHYYLLYCTSLWSDWPQVTAKFNLGVGPHPVQVSVKQQLGDEDNSPTGNLSLAWGPTGIEVKALVDRALSSYASYSIGMKHVTKTGLTWLLALKRGDVSFRVPIHVSTGIKPGYSSKFLLLGLLSGLIDSVIREQLEATALKFVDQGTKKNDERESSLLGLDKSKHDAAQQMRLMAKTAESFKDLEKLKHGLVILKATYAVEGGCVMDATIQLQFWVRNSRLTLPPTPKSHLLGFYSVAPTRTERPGSWWRWWFQYHEKYPTATQPIPKLTVRYEINDNVYEITVADDEGLSLPDSTALHLGRAGIVT